MTRHTRISLNSVLVGDELGQINLVELNTGSNQSYNSKRNNNTTHDDDMSLNRNSPRHEFDAQTLRENCHKHRITKIHAECLQREPAASRAILCIRPIENVHENILDTTDKVNNLFLITNKVGQIFVCDTNAVRNHLHHCDNLSILNEVQSVDEDDREEPLSPILSPVYYNMNGKIPVCGAQPINQTNVLVIYQNGDIQHVNINQDILQSSLKIKRKAIKMLGLGYNSDAKAVHWRIDGLTGICYFDSEASAQLNENDPLTEIVLSSPTHKLKAKRSKKSEQDIYNKSPCIKSRKFNEYDKLIPAQVINMITSRTEQYKPSSRICKWSSITSLNLLYRKLALYDLVGSENFEQNRNREKYEVKTSKLNDNRLALGGPGYALRVYDVRTQQAIYNCRTGSQKNPLTCPSSGEPVMIGDIDWLGGNKTTFKTPDLLGTCSGVDSLIKVYDLRSPKPVYHIDLTQQTEDKWQPYENHNPGCTFTSICSSAAPYSTAVPSQQLALGSTNGRLYMLDLRFVAKSYRTLGKLSGFCGGNIREIRFVSESFDTTKMISCASDRFIRIHRIQTSFTSVVSQKLATKVFLGTRPTTIQPVCDELNQNYLASSASRYGSDMHISSVDSESWALL